MENKKTKKKIHVYTVLVVCNAKNRHGVNYGLLKIL